MERLSNTRRPAGAGDFRLAIFDLDGTLLDTEAGIVSAITHTTDAFQLPRIEATALRSFIGPPIQKSFAAYYGLDVARANELAAAFRDRYKDVDLLLAKPYEGIYELLAALRSRGVCVAVATFKREDYAEKLLLYFGFDRYAEIRHGSDFAGKLQKSDIILRCIEESGVPAECAVMVGDGVSDVRGAAAAGIPCIGVTYGFGFADFDAVRAEGGLPCGSVGEILDYFL